MKKALEKDRFDVLNSKFLLKNQQKQFLRISFVNHLKFIFLIFRCNPCSIPNREASLPEFLCKSDSEKYQRLYLQLWNMKIKTPINADCGKKQYYNGSNDRVLTESQAAHRTDEPE